MTDRKLDNMDESAEDRSLGELLRTLERVDAPADFGFKVKARITQGDADVNRGKGWWPVPVYVYALGMILIVGSAFFFLYQPNGQPVPAVASKSDEKPRVSTSSPLTTAPPARNQEVAVSNNQKTAAPLPGDPRALQDKAKSGGDPSSVGGSRDLGLGNPQQILPPGFNANAKRPVGPPPVGNGASISVMLGFLGMDTRFEGQAMKITSVRSGSVAEKTGFKAGDIIEAIDGKPINSTTKLGTSFDAKSFTVRRGEETLQLGIRSQ